MHNARYKLPGYLDGGFIPAEQVRFWTEGEDTHSLQGVGKQKGIVFFVKF
jgi:hypothetical protein